MNPITASTSVQATLSAQIEAILFWKAEPISIKKLASLCATSEEKIREAIAELKASLITNNRGITVIEANDEVTLGTATALSGLIEQLTKDELMRDLGKAGLETLSIIIYQGPITRAEVDYIRGVNSQFIIRNLLVRGLIERRENPKDQRSFLYAPTLELIAHLGITKVDEMPEYTTVRNEITNFKTATQDETGAIDKSNEAQNN
ncbi:MAG: segregation and condensation protein segregation and condensation protein [Candidatus Parcubacteria bacterium]|jgi:segregation and condensation protein B